MKQEKVSLFSRSKNLLSLDEGILNYYNRYKRKIQDRRIAAPNKKIQDSWAYLIPIILEYFPEHKIMEDVTRNDIVGLISYLRKQGKKDSAIRGYIKFLQTVFNYNIDTGLLDSALNFRSIIKTICKSRARKRYLSEKEYDALIDSYVGCGYLLTTRKRMVIFDVESGLRLEELVSLQWEDVNLSSYKLHVKHTKNGNDRFVPLSPLAVKILQEQMKIKEDYKIISSFVFCKKNGEKYNSISKGFKNDLVRAKLAIRDEFGRFKNTKDIRIHDLRRTFGSWRLQGVRGKKMDLKEVSLMLGHSNTAQTEEAYAFLNEMKITLH